MTKYQQDIQSYLPPTQRTTHDELSTTLEVGCQAKAVQGTCWRCWVYSTNSSPWRIFFHDWDFPIFLPPPGL